MHPRREKFVTITARIPVGETKDQKPVYYIIKFIESFHFMSSSFVKLADNLSAMPHAERLKQRIPTQRRRSSP